jgi:hypothetical protein
MTVHCTEIDGKTTLEFWPELESFVIEALSYDLYNSITLQQLQRQIETGFARTLLCADDDRLLSVTIIQLFRNTQDERILHVLCTAGEDSNAWLATLFGALREMSSDQECDAITMAGRPGWARKLRQYGFKTDQVHMRLNSDVNIRREKREQVTLSAVR